MLKQRIPYIVVVDDERIIAETLTIILNSNGFAATFFYQSSRSTGKRSDKAARAAYIRHHDAATLWNRSCHEDENTVSRL
jgi:FixJ family two-component response regulator